LFHFNLLKGDTRTKLGIANKRLKAGWDLAYSVGYWAFEIKGLHAIALLL
jgi:hypothetical protein